jgi:hypothetical protein
LSAASATVNDAANRTIEANRFVFMGDFPGC